MKSVIIGIVVVMVLMTAQNSQALIVTPDSFEDNVEHGDTYSNHFRIIPENISQDVSMFYSSPFLITFLNKTFDNLSTYFDQDFNITIPKQFPEGTYTSYIFAVGENQTKVVDVTLTIYKNLNFSVDVAGDFYTSNMDFGFVIVTVENTGNELLRVGVAAESDEILSYIDDDTMGDVIIYPNLSVQIPVGYVTPDGLAPGVYDLNVTVTNNEQNISRGKTVKFHVNDTTPPKIAEIAYESSVEAGYTHEIGVKTTDNIGVKEVTLELIQNTTLVATEEIDGYYRFSYSKDAVGSFPFIVTVKDTSNNTMSETHTVMVEPYRGVEFVDKDYVKIKKEELFRFPVFRSNVSIPFCVEIEFVDFVPYGGNASYDYYLYVDDTKQRLEDLNRTTARNATIDSVCLEGKTMDMAFKSFTEGRLDMEFVIVFKEWIRPGKRINIGTEVSDRVIEKDVIKRIGSQTLNCTYSDREEWVCSGLTFPGTIDLDDIGTFVTERMYNDMVERVNATVRAKDTELQVAGFFSSMYIAIIVVIIVVLVLVWAFVIEKFQFDLPGG